MKKKKILKLISIILVILILLIAANTIRKKYSNRVTLNGTLKVENTKLKNQWGKTIQLKGVSSHGIQWKYADCINYENLKTLRDDWGINVFRIAMYTEEDGYIQKPEEIKKKVTDIVDMCIDLDIYVVVDWHILSDNNPNDHKQEAMEFFEQISSQYKETPNIIYEICNEPNGIDVGWKSDIMPYATDIINVIRKNAPKSIIIVGTSDWSKSIIEAANNQLPFENIMYAFHFYAGTHGEMYRDNIDYAIEKGTPIFVSEWGTTTYDVGEEVYEEESKKWVEFLEERNISWINWSFSNKKEATSILKENLTENINDCLTTSGKFIKSVIDTRK